MDRDLQCFYLNAFPKYLAEDVLAVLNYLQSYSTPYHSKNNTNQVTIKQEAIHIPARTYFKLPKNQQFSNFPLIQQQMLLCIYTRHHDGFIRQYMLQQLLEHELEYFVIPYIFQLAGEYVAEILQCIEPVINTDRQNQFAEFILENPRYFRTIESRIISYWNEYYRKQYPDFNDYIGAKILKKFKNCAQKYAHDSNKMR